MMETGNGPEGSGLRLSVLAIFTLLSLPYGGVHAQEDVDDLRREIEIERQKLSEQMQQLEEQIAESQRRAARLDELEAKLAGMQDAETEARNDVAVVAPASGTESADADMPERIVTGKNETRDAHQVLTAGDLIADDFIGSWPLFGSDYRMKIGGYVKLDALYDFSGSGD